MRRPPRNRILPDPMDATDLIVLFAVSVAVARVVVAVLDCFCNLFDRSAE